MARNYYFLVAGLPELAMEHGRKEFDVCALRDEVREHISPADYRLVEQLFLPFDNENLLNTLLKRGMANSPLGTLPAELFADLEGHTELMPPYMQQFYSAFIDSNEPLAHPELQLMEAFYKQALASKNAFVRRWFGFNRDLNNILTAINCRRMGIEVAGQLLGDGPIVEALQRSQAADFGLRQEVDYIDRLLQLAELPDVAERERRIDLLRWDMADELSTWDYFNVNFILAFFAKAIILHRWAAIDSQQGNQMFDRLFADLKASFSIEQAFAKQ